MLSYALNAMQNNPIRGLHHLGALMTAVSGTSFLLPYQEGSDGLVQLIDLIEQLTGQPYALKNESWFIIFYKALEFKTTLEQRYPGITAHVQTARELFYNLKKKDGIPISYTSTQKAIRYVGEEFFKIPPHTNIWDKEYFFCVEKVTDKEKAIIEQLRQVAIS